MKAPKYILMIAALAGCGVAFAQDKTKKIDTVEFNVVSKYKPVITDAVKLNGNPDVSDTVMPERKAEYNNLINSRFPTSYTPDPLQAIHLRGEPLDKLYHAELNAGVGNYNTLYGEFFYNCLRSRNYNYGIHLNHLSSEATLKNEGYSGYAFNDVNLFGETFLHNHTLYAQADFDNHILHNYGYDKTKDTLSHDITRESYNYIGGVLEYRSFLKDSSSINHDIKLSGHNFSDVYNASEDNVNAYVHLYTYYQRQRIDIALSGEYYHEKNRISKDTMNFWNLMFNPYFTEIQKKWDARLGVKVFFDPIASKFNYYPDFIARYRIARDAAIAYAGIDGVRTQNSYKSIADDNPFVIDTLVLHASSTMYHIFLGLSGTITPNLSYDVKGSQSEIDQMPLYATDTLDTFRNRFSVIYDKVKVIKGHAELTYIVKNNLRFTLGGDYYQYTSTDQAKVWYHPDMKISLQGQYIYHTNFVFKAMLSYIGTQYAPIAPSPQAADVTKWAAKTIDGYPDLNIGFDYKFSKPLTAFLNLNNLANVSYQRWLNYPTQGFNVMAGIRLGF